MFARGLPALPAAESPCPAPWAGWSGGKRGNDGAFTAKAISDRVSALCPDPHTAQLRLNRRFGKGGSGVSLPRPQLPHC